MSLWLLDEGDIHLWSASLQISEGMRQSLGVLLSGDEQAQAAKFAFERDRCRYVIARGTLRHILGRYLGLNPEAVSFEYGPYGKPALSYSSGNRQLKFNSAHSQELALYAVCAGREIGVDVERVRPVDDMEGIAAIAFSPTERAALNTLPQQERVLGFFNCWTRKEAYLKARGEGLLAALDAFDVSLVPDQPAALLADRTSPNAVMHWSIHTLTQLDGYVGAVAVEGQVTRLCLYHFAIV